MYWNTLPRERCVCLKAKLDKVMEILDWFSHLFTFWHNSCQGLGIQRKNINPGKGLTLSLHCPPNENHPHGTTTCSVTENIQVQAVYKYICPNKANSSLVREFIVSNESIYSHLMFLMLSFYRISCPGHLDFLNTCLSHQLLHSEHVSNPSQYCSLMEHRHCKV